MSHSQAVDFRTTLTQRLLQLESERSLAALLTQIAVAGKLIAGQVRRAGLIEVWGETGSVNVQGESVQRLDQIANDTLIEVLRQSGCVAAMASEEEEALITVGGPSAGNFVVVFDPLDGSSNIEVSTSIGTIFGIYRRLPGPLDERQVLRPGEALIGAGYLIYGSSTVLVYASHSNVDCFTLDPVAGEFFLTRPSIQTPTETSILSINQANAPYWPQWVEGWLTQLQEKNTPEARRVTGRHIGSLVADFHRNLLKGGIFLYPKDRRSPRGKLRLLYECNPLAFISRAAGGGESFGSGSVLSIMPRGLHDRSGLFVGTESAVQSIEETIATESAGVSK